MKKKEEAENKKQNTTEETKIGNNSNPQVLALAFSSLIIISFIASVFRIDVKLCQYV